MRHKHPIEGRWTLVSREGQANPAEATREFTKKSYWWVDNGRPLRVEEQGQYRVQCQLIITEHNGAEEIFTFAVQSDVLTIQQISPITGRVTIYRRIP